MIEFHLDKRSGVAPYQQVVQQVRHALRLGLLDVGDQLPTVKEVVASLAINPNTVLKAYKELEHLGLVAARPGIGTFVTRTLSDDSLAAHGPLRQDLQRWLAKARRAGLDEESIEALFRDVLSVHLRGRRSVTAVLEASGLGKRYGHKWALSRVHARHSRRQGRRARRTERRRQDDAAPSLGRAPSSETPARSLFSVGNPAPARANWPASASSPRTPRPTRDCRFAITCGFGAWMNPSWDASARRGTGSSSSGSTPARRPASSPAASAPSSPSPWRWRSGRSCSCSTSRSRASILLPGASSFKA